jgi:hypothetical protein
VGLHAIMGGFVELGRRAPELGGGRRHGELGVLRLGEFALRVVEGLQRVMPAFERRGELVRRRTALLLCVLGVAIFRKRILERDALVLQFLRGGFQRVGSGAGGIGGGVELGARVAQRSVVQRGIDIEQWIAGGDPLVVFDKDLDHRPGDLRGHAHDIRPV